MEKWMHDSVKWNSHGELSQHADNYLTNITPYKTALRHGYIGQP